MGSVTRVPVHASTPVPLNEDPDCVKLNVTTQSMLASPDDGVRQTPERLLIVTLVCALTESFPSLTVTLTVNVPATEYVCDADAPVPVPPSPKSHVYVSGSLSG